MADQKGAYIFGDLSGGLNGSAPPLQLRETECVDALNVDWWHASLARKRNGSTALNMAFTSGGPFTGILSTLIRHVPSTDDSVAELWGVDDAVTPVVGRFTPGSSSGSVDYLIVGGGAGGGSTIGGGGGGGKVVPGTDAITPGAFSIVVGAGGAATANGSSSSFNSHTATGGTAGASTIGAGGASAAGNAGGAALTTATITYLIVGGPGHLGGGGSNGGGGGGDVKTGTFSSASASKAITVGGFNATSSIAGVDSATGGTDAFADTNSDGQGNGGASGNGNLGAAGFGGFPQRGGGGGGAGGAASGVTAGAGASSSITGSSLSYGAGGKGDDSIGGGTAASDGGPGIVIVSYITGTLTATGGTIATVGGTTVHTFSTSGTFAITVGEAGGGGGSSAVGGAATAGVAGGGGTGTTSSISGSSVIYGSGGGGAASAGSAGTGADGGGTGGISGGAAATAGAVNRGGGGGGGSTTGGAGGSGLVILSYLTGTVNATGGTIVSSGARTTHTFTASGTFTMLVSGPGFVAPTLKDAPTGNGWDVTGASVNGKLFLSYKSAVNRLHVWDPVSNQVRRVGVAAPVVPTAANTGSGTYAAVLRFYRTRATVQIAGITVRRSEPSASVSFTPDASHAAARVTQGTQPNELETHWEVEASLDNITFYRIATVAIATTTYDDSAATGTYTTNPLSAATGTYTLPKSYKFIAGADNRLLGFGSFTATDKQDRIEFSAVVGSSDIGDAERIDTTLPSFIDLDESDSGTPTGLSGPVNGNYYALKLFQTWELRPTGDVNQPFATTCLSKTIGAVGPKAVCVGEDNSGRPALYQMSVVGPYRFGSGGYTSGTSTYEAGGLQYLGANVEHLTLGVTSGGAATTSTLVVSPVTSVPAHCVYHAAEKKVFFWYATAPNTDPTTLLVFDVVRSAWSRHTGIHAARCSVMFSTTLGAAMSFDRKPYIGRTIANTVWKIADPTTTSDAGTPYQAQAVTKPIEPGGPRFFGEVGDPLLLAQASRGVKITVTAAGDFDPAQTATGIADLTPDTSTQTRVERRCDGAAKADGGFVQYTIGDAAPVANTWVLDRLIVPVSKRGEKTT